MYILTAHQENMKNNKKMNDNNDYNDILLPKQHKALANKTKTLSEHYWGINSSLSIRFSVCCYLYCSTREFPSNVM